MSTQNECVWVLLSQTLTDCFSTLPTVGCVAIGAKANWKTGFSTSEELTESVHSCPRKCICNAGIFRSVKDTQRSSLVPMLLSHLDSAKVTLSTPAGQSLNSASVSLQVDTCLDTTYYVKVSWSVYGTGGLSFLMHNPTELHNSELLRSIGDFLEYFSCLWGQEIRFSELKFLTLFESHF